MALRGPSSCCTYPGAQAGPYAFGAPRGAGAVAAMAPRVPAVVARMPDRRGVCLFAASPKRLRPFGLEEVCALTLATVQNVEEEDGEEAFDALLWQHSRLLFEEVFLHLVSSFARDCVVSSL